MQIHLGNYLTTILPDGVEALYLVYSLKHRCAQLIECSITGNPITEMPTEEVPLTTVYTQYKLYRKWPPPPRGRPKGDHSSNTRISYAAIRNDLQARLDQGQDLAQAILSANVTPQEAFTALHLMAPHALAPILVSIADFVHVMQSARNYKCRTLIALTHRTAGWAH
jgi:hypothetical protein